MSESKKTLDGLILTMIKYLVLLHYSPHLMVPFWNLMARNHTLSAGATEEKRRTLGPVFFKA